MRRYEVVFVLAPTLTEEEFETQVETYSGVATELGAEIIETDKWGKRRFAFPVNKHSDGYFTVLTVDTPSDAPIVEMERRFKVNDAVIRFLTVRIDEEMKRAAKFEKKREAQKKKRRATPRSRSESKEAAFSSTVTEKGDGDDEA